MKTIVCALTVGIALCGCASNKPEVKKIYERPWIGGTFETVPTPKAVRTNGQHFAKRALLVTRALPETPLGKARVQEGDLALAVNGKNVRFAKEIRKAIAKAGAGPVTLTIYRGGEISEKAITPGIERFQKYHLVAFAIGFATRFVVDIYPNPDFSLIALGYEHTDDRLELRDPKAKYLQQLQATEGDAAAKEGWQGLHSDEGWKAWVGPLWFAQNKMIVSQEAQQ